MHEEEKNTIIVMQMTPHGGGTVSSGGEMRWIVAGCGRHRRRHIEDVCSLANAYSKSVLDLFTIHTRVQASRCPTLPSLTSAARVSNGWTGKGGGARGSARAVAEGGNTFAKKKKQCKIIHMH